MQIIEVRIIEEALYIIAYLEMLIFEKASELDKIRMIASLGYNFYLFLQPCFFCTSDSFCLASFSHSAFYLIFSSRMCAQYNCLTDFQRLIVARSLRSLDNYIILCYIILYVITHAHKRAG